jgi:hypothetical protein
MAALAQHDHDGHVFSQRADGRYTLEQALTALRAAIGIP